MGTSRAADTLSRDMLPLWDAEPHRRSPVMTTSLIVANLAVFAYEVSLAMESPRAVLSFVNQYALNPANLLGHLHTVRPWVTVLTSMFLHGGVAHILGNVWFLWVFGRNVEGRLGPTKFLIFYLLCGLGAAGLQVGMNPHSTAPMLGASGAISGVLGAYVVLYPLNWIYTLVPWFVPIVPLPALVVLLGWFAVQALTGVGSLLSNEAVDSGIAWWAHIGGFLTGLILIFLAKQQKWLRKS